MSKQQAEHTNGAVNGSLTHFIETNFDVADIAPVRRFVERNPDLAHLLEEAHGKLKETFGAAVTSLDLEWEYDEERRWEYLSLTVFTNLGDAESHKLMDQFDDDWWLDVNEERLVIMLAVEEEDQENR